MADKLNVDRLTKALSEILSEKYGCKVTITAIRKSTAQHNRKEKCKCI